MTMTPDHIIKMKLYIVATLFLFLNAIVYGQDINNVNNQPQIEYRCPPCGCDQDSLLFKSVGKCPRCNMQLVEMPDGFTKKLDRQLAPFLRAGMLGQLYTKLIYPVFAIGILLSLFLLFKSTRGKSLNIFLTGIILVLSLYGFKNQLYAVNYSLTNSYKSLFTPISFILLLGPLILFYIRSLTVNSFRWHPKYWIHFTLAALMFLYYSILSLMSESVKQQFMFSPFEVRFSHTEQILAVVIGLIYTASSYVFLRRWKAANPIRNTKITAWVTRFLVGLGSLLLVWGMMIAVNFWIYDFGVATVSYNPLWLTIGIVLIWLGIEVISNLKFFLLNKRIQLVNGNASMTNEELSSLKKKLEQLMQDQKLYTDPDLSLDALAVALDINPKYLSVILNNSVGKNFYDFVNQYRIEEVKTRLSDLRSRNFTIEAIANQAGFRSKSSFNAAFRKQTNMTPREYIKQN